MVSRLRLPEEIRRQAVQARIDSLRPAAERNRLGQFATPNDLALEIARYVRSVAGAQLKAIRFADPALGTGSFFSAALNVFGPHRIGHAVGVEIDRAIGDAARDLWQSRGLDVRHGDFTQVIASSPRPRAPNLVLANPPYVRHHHIETADKERLRALVRDMAGVEVSGLAGLYVYFLLLATAWMEPGGHAAWLVPSEFMDVNYGGPVKQYLTTSLTLLRVHRFDPAEVQFEDALVSSVVLVFRKAEPPSSHAAEFTFGGSLSRPRASEYVTLEELRTARKWTGYPRHETNDRRTASVLGAPTLGQLFRIQRGIATGNNEVFVLEACEARRLHLPARYLRPILPSPRLLKTTVIDADKHGVPAVDPRLFVIDCDLPQELVRERHPRLWEYLSAAERQGVRDGYLVSRRSPWYKQEKRDPAPFLCTYMGRGADAKKPFRFIWNRSTAIATNLYLMLFPRGGLATMLRDHPARESELFGLLSEITAHELRGEGRVYGGGLNKIEPRELGRVSAASIVSQWPELLRDLRAQSASG